MKIAEMREGQRVTTWQGRGGEVLYVQPEGVTPDDAELAALHAAIDDCGDPRQSITTTPAGAGNYMTLRRALVRLDRVAVTSGRHTYLGDVRYLWAAPSDLSPEADDE
jgi:poly(3-hydroxybutyrate) depolymerase